MDDEQREALADGAYRALKEFLDRPAFLDLIHDAIRQGVIMTFPSDADICTAIKDGVNSAFPFDWQLTHAVEMGVQGAMERE